MIIFKEVRYKNLLSSGNKFTKIPLNSHQTTLILGENGAVKSKRQKKVSRRPFGYHNIYNYDAVVEKTKV